MKEVADKSLSVLRRFLPSKCVVLFLSETGSRAFGWGWSNLDWDIHGVFYCKGDFWFDWVHYGKDGLDLNVWDLWHVEWYAKQQSFEMFVNYGNPIYVNPRFDYEGMMQLLTLRAVKNHLPGIRLELARFRNNRSPRSALHAYRVALQPLSYLVKGKIAINVVEYAEEIGLDLRWLAERYRLGKGLSEDEVKSVIRNVEEVLGFLESVLREKEMPTYEEIGAKVSSWAEGVRNVFNRLL